ncbi:hypothetical protein F0U59_03200 [Archangium gephyra]|nr:hypothetical protein F0U59_03200 [Archangium gephyra]
MRSIVTRLSSLLALVLGASASAQQGAPSTPPRLVVVRAARMLDVQGGAYVSNPVILIENGRISPHVSDAVVVPQLMHGNHGPSGVDPPRPASGGGMAVAHLLRGKVIPHENVSRWVRTACPGTERADAGCPGQ